MKEMYLKFNLLSDNEFWSILKKANDFHVSKRDQYESLLAVCKSKGVAFKDIKSHLLNQAKKCGLYNRSMWSDSKKEMVYRSWSDLLTCKYAWAIALHNFMVWLKANYKEYGIEVNRIAHKNPVKVVKTNTVLRKTTDDTGKISETRTETVHTETVSKGASAPKAPEAQQSVSSEAEVENKSLIAPVTESLTQLQIQVIVLQNLKVLGEICKAKSPDALQFYNDMIACLELDDMFVDED